RYRRHLLMSIAPSPVHHLGDPKKLKCHLGRLAEPDAIGILAVIWSRYITEKKLVNTRGKKGPVQRITRHSLGKALESSAGSNESSPKFLRRASRIVEAGITYGLIVEIRDRAACVSGCKPLYGTKRLDEFMTALGFDFAVHVR